MMLNFSETPSVFAQVIGEGFYGRKRVQAIFLSLFPQVRGALMLSQHPVLIHRKKSLKRVSKKTDNNRILLPRDLLETCRGIEIVNLSLTPFNKVRLESLSILKLKRKYL